MLHDGRMAGLVKLRRSARPSSERQVGPSLPLCWRHTGYKFFGIYVSEHAAHQSISLLPLHSAVLAHTDPRNIASVDQAEEAEVVFDPYGWNMVCHFPVRAKLIDS